VLPDIDEFITVYNLNNVSLHACSKNTVYCKHRHIQWCPTFVS